MVEPLELGRFISTCRKEKNLTQKQLGEELGDLRYACGQGSEETSGYIYR